MEKRTVRLDSREVSQDIPAPEFIDERTEGRPSHGSSTDAFVRRRTEVEGRDHEEFQAYLADKKEAEARKAKAAVPTTLTPTKSSRFSRRTIFNVAIGTAAAAEAGVLAYNSLGLGGRSPIMAHATPARITPKRSATTSPASSSTPGRICGGRA